MKRIRKLGLTVTAAIALGVVGGTAVANQENQQYQLAQSSTTTIIEQKTEILPDMPETGLSTSDTTAETRTYTSGNQTDVYRTETTVLNDVDANDIDENDAEVASLSLTTLLIFALLAFTVVAIVVALSRRERPVI